MCYYVIRTDDLGNSFVVKSHLTLQEAQDLVIVLTDRAHKQYYETCVHPDCECDN